MIAEISPNTHNSAVEPLTFTIFENEVKVLVAQLCPTLCNPMDYSPPSSSVHGILQTRILQWIQFSSVIQSCVTLCHPKDCSAPGLIVHHQLLKNAQTHIHRVGDAIQPSYPLLSPFPPAFNFSQHQGLSPGISSSNLVAKALELQLQHQSFQWIFRADSSFCIDWSPYTPRDSQESSPLAQFNVSIHWHSAFFII